MKFSPTKDQQNFIEFILKNKKTFGILDLGAGKTAASLSVAAKTISSFQSKGFLVVAPLEVCKLTWPSELKEWDCFKWMSYSLIHGPMKNRYLSLSTKSNIFLINYENLIWLAEILHSCHPSTWPFDSIIFDESSKMKAYNTKRFRKFAGLTKHFKYVVHLTGTPRPNSELDLWAQVYLLDQGQSIHDNYFKFRSEFARAVDRENRIFKLRSGAGEEIYKKIQHLIYTTPPHLKKEKKPAFFENIELKFDKQTNKTYQELEKQGMMQINQQEQEFISIAKLGKCKQFVGGCIFHGIGPDGKYLKTYDIIHDLKINELKKLCKKIKNGLIIYEYNHEKEQILRNVPGAVEFSKNTTKIIEEWNNNKIQFLVCHSASKSMGLNLQYGGNNIIWYSLPWSYENYYQMIGRLRRTGQTKTVGVYHLIIQETIDWMILELLRFKEAGSKHFHSCIENYIKLKGY